MRSVLRAVSALSGDDVWAVGLATLEGSGAQQTLTEHWDGASWTIVPSPNRSGRDAQNALWGVTAISTNDVWAVGFSVDLDSPTTYSTLTEHWDGAAWSIIPSPNSDTFPPNTYNALTAVSAVSSNDVWAVGGSPVASSGRALFMHWDGTTWSLFPAPRETERWVSSSRFGVAAVAPDDVWSVGDGESIRWNGSSWNEVLGAQDHSAVAAAGPAAVWAAGSFTLYDGEQFFGPFTKAADWDGTRWISTGPQSPRWDDVFAGVTVSSAADVWAVGRTGRVTLTEHWDGASWAVVPSPNGNPDAPSNRRDPNMLLAASALASNDVWAVGYFYENDGFTQRTLIEHFASDGSVLSGRPPAIGNTRAIATPRPSGELPARAKAPIPTATPARR